MKSPLAARRRDTAHRPSSAGALARLALSITGLSLAGLSLSACGSGSSGSAPAPATTAVSTAALTASTTSSQIAAGPPQKEKWVMVTSKAAPLLGELEDDDPPEEVIREGELLKITKEIREFHWDAKMDGKDDKRKGMAVDIQYADEGAHKYGFKPDFGGEVSVPVTSWLCDEIAKQGPFDRARCPGLLRRAKTADGSILVYATCSVGACPVGLVKDDKLTTIPIENLTTAWFFTGKKRSVLYVATRWTKDSGQQSGGSLFRLIIEDGKINRGEELQLDTIDARDPKKSFARLVHASVLPDGITLEGEETTKDADGKVLFTNKIQQKTAIPSLD